MTAHIKEDMLTVFTEFEVPVPEVHDTVGEVDVEPPAPEDFDLDIRFVESGPVVEELMRPTDDGCGRTCQSACTPSCP